MKNQSEPQNMGFLRILLVIIVIILQLLLIIFLVETLRNNAVYVYFLIEAASLVAIFLLVSRNKNTAYTVAWLLIICLMPVFGFLLYLLWGGSGTGGKRNDKIRASMAYGEGYLKQDEEIYNKLNGQHPERKRMTAYLKRMRFPLYQNTECDYFSLGEYQFEAMIEDLKNAKQFIFMEYFILHEGKLWSEISEVLIQKAQEGVEIRLMFDDFGSILTASDQMVEELKNYGIQIIRFNPIHKFISRLYINFRNHQKITIIDGRVGYTGGTNLADEYANYYPKHGHWKDTAIRLKGDSIWSLTVTFLQLWDAEAGGFTDYEAYRRYHICEGEGFFQPFHDGPVNNPENPAEMMYHSVIAGAKEYVYITTPYLVIDNKMQEELCAAALSGVDVRIVTPKIWDHWYVHAVTRSNYRELLKAGVKIYEYTPGYIHAKTIISDDDNGITGSINMDYRSFNLHFENGVWICGHPVLAKIKEDMIETFAVSEEILLKEWNARPWYQKGIEEFLRIFAVLF